MPDQSDWRYCHKCESMFFDGYPGKGVCKAGGAHEAQGFMFVLPHDVPETPTAQSKWRFCHKCESMFYDGYPGKGVCAAGGAHEAQGYMFVLPHDVPETPTAQRNWRFCHKCESMFYDGYPGKGVCAAGGAHEAQGYMFVLPHVDETTVSFDSGPVTSSLPLGGSAHVVMRQNGDFTFSGHAHDSGFNNIDYVLSAVLMTTTGIAFTFQHSGHVEGTSCCLPFGTPNRNNDFVTSGNNPSIKNEWAGMHGAKLGARLDGKDTLLQGLQGVMSDLLKQVASELEKAAASAVVALVS